jgi:hypothetical protein
VRRSRTRASRLALAVLSLLVILSMGISLLATLIPVRRSGPVPTVTATQFPTRTATPVP